ncbi:unnamed protein product [Cuscuta europaea]|uniref:EIF3F/CSN6-like C-terminal domain-containing protein n=1 Tax=Cuscuta europaea TaxID=41803 RepID=A0A9P0ZFC2_CUSEU|nr:unnamed protein product [Cuscuta europaea]
MYYLDALFVFKPPQKALTTITVNTNTIWLHHKRLEFQEIPLDLRMIEAEQVGFDIMKKTAVDKLPNDLEGMEASMERMLVLINDVHKYVYDVVEGRIPTDNNLGRLLYETVNTIPKLSPPEFDKLVNDGLQDQ